MRAAVRWRGRAQNEGYAGTVPLAHERLRTVCGLTVFTSVSSGLHTVVETAIPWVQSHHQQQPTGGDSSMARLAAKARCNYYPLPDREAELIRSCLTFPDQPFSAMDPCAGEGRAMAVITGSSQALKYGIELDSYRAEAATKVLDHVIQGDALSAHTRVESLGLTYCNPPFDAEFGQSGNQRFEVLFLSHFARWLVPGGVLICVLPAQQLAGCAHVLASHFRDVQVFRLESPECVLYGQ